MEAGGSSWYKLGQQYKHNDYKQKSNYLLISESNGIFTVYIHIFRCTLACIVVSLIHGVVSMCLIYLLVHFSSNSFQYDIMVSFIISDFFPIMHSGYSAFRNMPNSILNINTRALLFHCIVQCCHHQFSCPVSFIFQFFYHPVELLPSSFSNYLHWKY